jgi:hypothetical protein
MSLSKSKCWYSNNCLHFLKRTVPFRSHFVAYVELRCSTNSPQASEIGLLNMFTSDLSSTQSVTKIISVTAMNLVAPKAGAKGELLFNKLASGLRGAFVEQKLMLSSSFRCDLICNCYRYDFGHNLLCYLSWY